MLWLAGDVKEPSRLSQRVGHEVPGVVVWPLLLSEGWCGKCSEIQFEGKHSIHFTSLCVTVLNIFSKEIISNNIKRRKQILKFI